MSAPVGGGQTFSRILECIVSLTNNDNFSWRSTRRLKQELEREKKTRKCAASSLVFQTLIRRRCSVLHSVPRSHLLPKPNPPSAPHTDHSPVLSRPKHVSRRQKRLNGRKMATGLVLSSSRSMLCSSSSTPPTLSPSSPSFSGAIYGAP